ncbi:MAG: hypothetical protein PUB07_04280 [Clostridia bacterium]|nr:hypothetical protein [Clostridia bacterium]
MQTVVSLLGYDMVAASKGGWPGGYTTVATSLKIYRDVDASPEALPLW